MRKLKKILPFLFVFGALSSYLVIQVYFDASKSEASRAKLEQKQINHYNETFQRLELQTINSDAKVRLSHLPQDIVVINFWASWCRPCLSEFKSLNKLAEKYGEKLKIIGINSDETEPEKKIKRISKKYKLSFDSVADPYGKIASLFEVTTIPFSVIYVNGKVVKISQSEVDFMSKNIINSIESHLIK